eukprot:3508308-Prymnesium_polylepis.1
MHMRYYEIEEDDDGVPKKKDYSFIDKWMRDPRMDAEFLRAGDKAKRYYWTRFTMCPRMKECPDDEYNLWNGFAADKLDKKYDDDARAGLLQILEFHKMLCSGNRPQYDFMLDILAHLVQYPEVKLGVALCLVGKQGAGKGHEWSIIERIVGKAPATYVTAKPEKNVYGDNNPNLREAMFIRVTEADKKKMAGHIGELRTYITDSPVETRSLYCKAINIANFTRFFFDTNEVDALPDNDEERRYFIIKVCEKYLNNIDYFSKVDAAIESDGAIRALFDFLQARAIKKRYGKHDVPVGDYQKTLKEANRSYVDQFVKWIVLQQETQDSTGKFKDEIVASMYVDYRGGGDVAERNKRSILRELELVGIDGVTKPHPIREGEYDENDHTLKQKWATYYHFDYDKLRMRYEIGADTHTPVAVTPIDCERDIAQWEAKTRRAQLPTDEVADAVMDTGQAGPSGVPPPAVGEKRGRDDDDDSDDDDVSSMELGRRMYSRGEMPSPGDADVLAGYHMARAAEYPGCDNCPFDHANNVEQQQICRYCGP